MKIIINRARLSLKNEVSKMLFTITIVVMIPFLAISQTNSTADGLWTAGSNWTNGAPNGSELVFVTNDIILDTDIEIENYGSLTIKGGSLIDPRGGSKSKIKIKDSGKLEIQGNVTIGGELKVEDNGELIVRGCDTLRIGGKLELKDDSKLTLEDCAVIIVDGEFKAKDDVYAVIDGNVVVDDKVESSKNAIIAGKGYIEADKKIDIKNNSVIFGSNIGCDKGPCTAGSGSALPVVLVKFNARFVDSESIEVEWATRSEINNNYYTLCTSTDGINFGIVDKVLGAGNSSKKLEYRTIIRSSSEEILYLKLMQTDFDGKSETFKPITVSKRYAPIQSVPMNEEVLLFPNPGDGQSLFMVLKDLESTTFNVNLFSSSGELIISKRVVKEQMDSAFEIQLLKHVVLQKGLYVIQVVSAESKIEKKYIVH